MVYIDQCLFPQDSDDDRSGQCLEFPGHSSPGRQEEHLVCKKVKTVSLIPIITSY